MIKTYSVGGRRWVDINRGTPEEIGEIMRTYDLHPFVAKELSGVTAKPRVESHNGYIYCILHFPAWKHTHTDKNQEIDFIICRDVLITSRYDTIDTLHRFAKELEVEEVLQNDHFERNPQALFIHLLRELYKGLFEELTYLEEVTEQITARIFNEKEREMVAAISSVTRTLLDFKKVTDWHEEILLSLGEHGRTMFGNNFGIDMEAIMHDYTKLNGTIKSNLNMLRELRETNNSLLSAKQNETIKKLALMGFVIFPLTLIATLFSMQVDLPLANNPNAFWMILVTMVAVTLIMLTYAKSKKWL